MGETKLNNGNMQLLMELRYRKYYNKHKEFTQYISPKTTNEYNLRKAYVKAYMKLLSGTVNK